MAQATQTPAQAPAGTVVVMIGPNQALDVQVVSDTEILATYAGGGEGPEDVVVTTRVGEARAAGAFYAQRPPPPPAIAAVTPAGGTGGTRVRITGSGFAPPPPG